MHRYQPRFHVVQADDLYSVRWSVFQTFTFSETTFTAVTVYQNTKVSSINDTRDPEYISFLVFETFLKLELFPVHRSQS